MHLSIHFLSILIIAIAGALAAYVIKKGSSPVLNVALLFLAFVSMAIYFHFFKMYELWPSDSVYLAKRGNVPKKSLVHWHEIFHYYLGGKYFKELRYTGLYDTVLLADHESSQPVVQLLFIKDLGNLPHLIAAPKARERAVERYRPNFSEKRWKEFKADLDYMKSISPSPQWLHKALYDAGFNPPPTWALIGSSVANMVPISHRWFPGTAFEQIEILAVFDIVLLLLLLFFLARSFGIPNLAFFLIVFGTSYLADFAYNFGSFFRYTWFIALGLALCLLKEEKFFIGGMFLALSVMDRIFPIFFAAGISVSLLYRYWQNRSFFYQLRNFCLGLLSVGLLMLILSVLIYGFQSWTDFVDRIVHHSGIFFTNHFGYKKIVTFDDWVYNQNFWWEEGTVRFIEWNERLNRAWSEKNWTHLPLMLAFLSGAIWNARRMNPEEAALHVGAICLFFFTIAANYYYIFFAFIPIIMIMPNASNGNLTIACGLFVCWGLLRFIPYFEQDYIIQNYYSCYLLFLFLLCWLMVRLIGTLTIHRAPLTRDYRRQAETIPDPHAPVR